MSMDRDYQTKDQTYDAVNKKLIIGVALLAIVIAGLWLFLAWMFGAPIPAGRVL
jgi:phosphate/sulfate permease